ncbi:response regulator [Oceanibaculum sp.]|uniref:response regulator n=1 Tax=Oceanibaculum sp. TaxID=1903597 RepID=UPI0025834045|nr:response regulator [Oceanibaculum sp.]MCH2394510.1 response regulator [Oceanibaculum sp.]
MSVNFKALKIVIIEDEDFIRVLIRRLLHQLGVELIYEAKEGGEGLKEVVRTRPDIVLCDIHMEPMDGLTFLNRLRSLPMGLVKDTPVVFLTADAQQETVMQAKKLWVNGYLVKPVSLQSLERRIVSILAVA